MNGNRPAVALFCATFLRPEMLHIHRHIAGLKNFSPVVLTQKREGDWEAEKVEVVPRSAFRFVGRGIARWTRKPWQISHGEAERIRIIIRENKAALLHIFFGNVAVHLLPVLERAGVPVVVSFHGSDVAGDIATPGYAEARRTVFLKSKLILCRSKDLAQKVVALGCDPAKIRIMRTVLPEIEFSKHQPPGDGRWRIVQASRLVPKKGLLTSLRAFAIFLKSHPAAKFVIAGEGPLDEKLRDSAMALGISGNVEFAGFLSQETLLNLYRDSHIFLHPSETVGGDVEGIPNSLLEAMASGLPSVATEHGGISEAIQHGATGLLCEEGDPESLAAALLQLAGDPELYSAISRAGSDFVKAEFSATTQIANIEHIYREASGAA